MWALIPSTRALPLWFSHFSQTPAFNTITWSSQKTQESALNASNLLTLSLISKQLCNSFPGVISYSASSASSHCPRQRRLLPVSNPDFTYLLECGGMFENCGSCLRVVLALWLTSWMTLEDNFQLPHVPWLISHIHEITGLKYVPARHYDVAQM